MQNELKYIRMVYEKGTFSKAARALYMTQPALSIAIAKIESEIGMPLFDRSQKPLRLTEAGKIYITKIHQMELLENELQNQLLDLTSMASGTVRIGATSYIISCILPPVLKEFKQRYPGITLELTEAGAYELKWLLREQKLDITFLTVHEKDAPFSITPAFTDHLLLAVPKEFPVNAALRDYALTAEDVCARVHLEPDAPVADLKEFAGVPFVLLGSRYNMRTRADAIFGECGMRPNVCMEVAQILTSYALAQAGMGAAFVPDLAAAPLHKSVLFYRLDSPHAVRSMHAATHTASYLSRAAQRFLEILSARANAPIS